MSNINLNQDMQTLEVGLKQAVFTGVLLHAGQNAKGEAIDYLAGTDTNVLEVNVPNGTKAIAQTILDGLKMRGYRYQPFNSERTITDPAIEIGDNVTANGTKAVVMGYDITHSRLMAPTLKAPYDEEVITNLSLRRAQSAILGERALIQEAACLSMLTTSKPR